MKSRRRKAAQVLSWICLTDFIILLIIIVWVCGVSLKNERDRSQLAQLHVAEDISDWSHGLLNLNSDYAGWLTVFGTNVDYPVVLGETNDTYLRHNFFKEPSEAGTLFLDEKTDLDSKGNLIIYGHKMNDGSMFGGLDEYKSKDFFMENDKVLWEDVDGEHFFKLFAAMVVPGSADDPRFIDFQKYVNNISSVETKEMLETIKDHAFIYREPKISENDRCIFLITCDYTRYNGRLVLIGESLS